MDLDKEFQNNPYAMATFLIDGIRVQVHNILTSNTLEKVIYVNGTLKGSWCTDKEAEEAQRFAYVTERFVHGLNFRKEMKKLCSVFKGLENPDIDKKIEVVSFWTKASFKVLLKQWKEREINKSIELVDSDGAVLFKFK